ncbi:hypothetical protein BDZ90DRAFT_233388 [Jaminaea rosea]|uniref:Uncharacterized protein n=1 Tax=Jaminaea rosea TaxID=1569628 RepID=A0A316ULT8_9BASI|nr:hypothetical protein BDZ90DRAFT_233388 [Jaminaea rosea]PWN26252.1 hypothetical protein BDZ90DRAFT_233388 [Jaminaea rosea]
MNPLYTAVFAPVAPVQIDSQDSAPVNTDKPGRPASGCVVARAPVNADKPGRPASGCVVA